MKYKKKRKRSHEEGNEKMAKVRKLKESWKKRKKTRKISGQKIERKWEK